MRRALTYGSKSSLALWVPFLDAGAGIVNTTPSVAKGSGAPTFARATTATTVLSTGLVGSVASGQPRSLYSPAGVYLGYYAEQISTNLCLQSENFGTTWVAIGTPIRTSGADTCGTVSLDSLNDADAGTLDGYSQVVTFTSNAVKAISVYVKAGTSTSSVIRVRDTTATADVLLVTLAWSGGVPTPTATTGTVIETQALGNSVFRVRMATATVTAANTNQIEIYPATTSALVVGNTGTMLCGGVQAENNTFPTSYIPTTTATVTRNADNLTYPFAGNANAATGSIYAEVMTEWTTTPSIATIVAFNTSGGNAALFVGGLQASTTVRTNDGTTTVSQTGLTDMFTGIRKRVSSWGSNGLRVGGDGAALANGVFDGAMANTSVGVGAATNGSTAMHGTIKNFKLFVTQLADGQLAAP